MPLYDVTYTLNYVDGSASPEEPFEITILALDSSEVSIRDAVFEAEEKSGHLPPVESVAPIRAIDIATGKATNYREPPKPKVEFGFH